METLAYILAAIATVVIVIKFLPTPKLMIAPLAIVALCLTAMPQANNVHVAYGTGNTVAGGFDYNKDRFIVSGSAAVSPICKTPGGCGHQFDIRGTVARRVSENVAIQGGIVNSYYKVNLFDKDAFQLLGGVRLTGTQERLVGEINYRHDLTSPNRLRIGEAIITAYLPKHIFLRTGVTFSTFDDFYGKSKRSTGTIAAAGFYF